MSEDFLLVLNRTEVGLRAGIQPCAARIHVHLGAAEFVCLKTSPPQSHLADLKCQAKLIIFQGLVEEERMENFQA